MARLSGKIAKQYAKAVFNLSDQNTMEVRRDALQAFADTWQESIQLRRTIENPNVPLSERLLVVQDLAENLRPGDEIFSGLLSLLLENRRLAGAAVISEVLTRLINKYKKQLSLTVTSAAPLPEAEESAIQERAKSEYGSMVSIDWKVDADLIGGLIVQAGDKVLDTSVRGFLEQIKDQLRA